MFRGGIILAGVLILAALCAVFYVRMTDSGYIFYKRMKAETPYQFDEIPDSIRQIDASKLIHIQTAEDSATRRRLLRQAIWEDQAFPAGLLPQTVKEVEKTRYGIEAWNAPISKIERFTVPIDFGYVSVGYIVTPDQPNGRGVVYSQGYAGTIADASLIGEALLSAGYTVALLNYVGYGENRLKIVDHPDFGPVSFWHDRVLYFADRPLRFYLEPAIVAANQLRIANNVRSVDAVGFSAGGWISTVIVAADTRFRRSAAVASLLPFYLRNPGNQGYWPAPHQYPPLIHAANYLDMAVLAASGEQRGYIQVFNQYDRCCYSNRFGELYEDDVSDAVSGVGDGGMFKVHIDQTHADHILSAWAADRILDLLESP